MKTAAIVFCTILGTGAFLHAAGTGRFGTSLQGMAQYVTIGYGVGTL